MGIRLVGDGGDVFWFTGRDWEVVVAFARAHGWASAGRPHPDEWDDDAATWNAQYEIVGGAHLPAADAGAFADAVARGLAEPERLAIRQIVDERNAVLQRAFPDRRVEVSDLADRWAEFVAFARSGGFRVDLTD